jgi:zinc protease
MKSIRTIAIAAILALSSLASMAQVKDYRDIKTPPLHVIPMPQPKRIQLANGMVILLMEDHELPIIDVTLNIRGGEEQVPAEKTGLASIYGQSWRTGGTEKQTGDQLDEFLESRAAHVETQADDDSSSVSMDVLKNDFDTVFPIFLDVLRNPAFRQEKIDLAKTQANTAISRRNDDPQSIATREAAKLVYGASSPYARTSEYATINAITRDDLVAFHKRFTYPNNMILGVAGDFDSASMEKKLRAAFESWPKGPDAPKSTPSVTPAKPGVYAISKSDVTQSNVYLVHPGIRRDNPDIYAVAVLNEVLGAAFSGRLFNEVRTARGLAYHVGGGVGWDWDHPGMFNVNLSTKSGSTVEAIGATRTVLTEMQSKPATAEELAQAKDALLNAFVFTRASKSQMLSQRIGLEFYGYPADWYDRYVPAVQKVTTEDVTRVANKYLQPDQVALLVVGNEKDYDKPLSTLGGVTPIDITIVEPGAKPASASAKPAGSNPEGVALLKKVADFMGGKAKIDTINAVHTQGTLNVNTPQGAIAMDIDSTTAFPDHHRLIMKTPMGEMQIVATSQAGFMIAPGGSQDLPGSRRDEMLRDIRRELHWVVRDSDKPGHTFTMTGTEKVGDINAQILEIGLDGTSTKWWVDPATGRVLRKLQSGAQGEVTTEYSEWKDFGGLKVPTKYVAKRNGEEVASGDVKSMEINPAIDPKIFEKPVK